MRKPIAVSDLLAEGQKRLKRLAEGAEAAGATLAAVQKTLPTEVSRHVSAALLKGADLTIVVDSSGWATRVRYAAADLAPALGQALGAKIGRVRVRVRPRTL